VAIYDTARHGTDENIVWRIRIARWMIKEIIEINAVNTGCFIMFSVITNIYNKKTRGPTFNGIVHSHRKTEKVYL